MTGITQEPTGDGAEFDRLYSEFGSWLLNYARLMSPIDAEDIVQEAFAVLIRRAESSPPVGNPRGYLVGVVQNLATKRTKQVGSALWKADYHLDHYQDPELGAAFEELSPQQQTCIALRYGKDLTIPQIAELLELDLSTVKTHIHRALVRLKQQLGDDG